MENPPGVCLIVIKKHPKATEIMNEQYIEHVHMMTHDLNHNVYLCTKHECCIQATQEQQCHPAYMHFHAQKVTGSNSRNLFTYVFS